MKNTTGKSLSILLILLISFPVSGADTLRIHVTYKHRLDAEGRTKGYTAIHQQFFTPERVLFREISYDEMTSRITRYTFFFHEGGKLSSAETYNDKDSLLFILKYRYDGAGRQAGTDSLVPSGNTLAVAGRKDFLYRTDGRISQIKAFAGRKPAGSIRFAYDTGGNLIRQTGKYKPVSGSSLKSETRLITYNRENKHGEVAISGKTMQGRVYENKAVYSYAENGLVSSISYTGTDYPAGLVKGFRYLPSGTISLYQETDAAGKFSLLLQYDYKKHYMDRGTQISRLAKM